MRVSSTAPRHSDATPFSASPITTAREERTDAEAASPARAGRPREAFGLDGDDFVIQSENQSKGPRRPIFLIAPPPPPTAEGSDTSPLNPLASDQLPVTTDDHG
ncbi:unnamed protein product [Tilletia controversa]|nr:unnamed protein product [Tilletia controversa]CAD6942682.1 unnamed protein product [Tilletia controversa]